VLPEQRAQDVDARAQATDQAKLPPVADEQRPLPEGTAVIADILKLALKVVCDAHGIAPRLVASSSDIEAIAAAMRAMLDATPREQASRHAIAAVADLTPAAMAARLVTLYETLLRS